MNETIAMQVKTAGEGKPLLLVPGGLTGWQSWEPFVEIFSADRRKVIRVQLLSVQYGLESQLLPANYSVKTESGALESALDSLGFSEPIDIVAWSFGALVSLDFALDNPRRVRSLTLIEPPAIWVLRESELIDFQTQQTLNFFDSLQGEITEDMLESFLNEAGFVKPGLTAKELPQWNGWLPFRQSLRNCPAAVNHKDKLQRIKNFKQPVLLIKGTGSATFLHNIISGLALNFPNARVIEMPGGHAPHLVSREKFLAELEKFQNETK
jgi:pimeloyl-ACP methyl ester carboxylesterase